MHVFTSINGVLVPNDQAVLPVADRGFRFGDGVFETINILQGVACHWAGHIARLERGLAALRIEYNCGRLKGYARELILKNNVKDGFLRISISRGVGSVGYLPKDTQPNVVIEFLPSRPLPDAPFRLHTSQYRRMPLSCLPANNKISQGLGSTLALMEAQAAGYDDALQLSTDGKIACAASGNIFWIQGDRLFTPALSTGCLAGTTRARILALQAEKTIECEEDIRVLHHADAMFISNSRLGVWPVANLCVEGQEIAFNVNDFLTNTLQKMLEKETLSYINAHQNEWKKGA